MPISPDATSSYLGYLPAIFQDPDAEGGQSPIGRFLLAFEQVLTGLQDVDSPGFEEILEGFTESEPLPGQSLRTLGGVERYFDPGVRTPGAGTDATGLLPLTQCVPDREFLDWLASWVALVPRADVSDGVTRQLVARAVSLYRQRGTKIGLEALLSLYALGVRIEEPTGWLQVGVSSTVGVDTILDGPPPHYFHVVLAIAEGTPSADVDQQISLLRAIIDAEKPAHTYYTLDTILPDPLQVEVHSTVGVDTIIGEAPGG